MNFYEVDKMSKRKNFKTWIRFQMGIGGTRAVAQKIVDTASEKAGYALSYNRRMEYVDQENYELGFENPLEITPEYVIERTRGLMGEFETHKQRGKREHDEQLDEINRQERFEDQMEEIGPQVHDEFEGVERHRQRRRAYNEDPNADDGSMDE